VLVEPRLATHMLLVKLKRPRSRPLADAANPMLAAAAHHEDKEEAVGGGGPVASDEGSGDEILCGALLRHLPLEAGVAALAKVLLEPRRGAVPSVARALRVLDALEEGDRRAAAMAAAVAAAAASAAAGVESAGTAVSCSGASYSSPRTAATAAVAMEAAGEATRGQASSAQFSLSACVSRVEEALLCPAPDGPRSRWYARLVQEPLDCGHIGGSDGDKGGGDNDWEWEDGDGGGGDCLTGAGSLGTAAAAILGAPVAPLLQRLVARFPGLAPDALAACPSEALAAWCCCGSGGGGALGPDGDCGGGDDDDDRECRAERGAGVGAAAGHYHHRHHRHNDRCEALACGLVGDFEARRHLALDAVARAGQERELEALASGPSHGRATAAAPDDDRAAAREALAALRRRSREAARSQCLAVHVSRYALGSMLLGRLAVTDARHGFPALRCLLDRGCFGGLVGGVGGGGGKEGDGSSGGRVGGGGGGGGGVGGRASAAAAALPVLNVVVVNLIALSCQQAGPGAAGDTGVVAQPFTAEDARAAAAAALFVLDWVSSASPQSSQSPSSSLSSPPSPPRHRSLDAEALADALLRPAPGSTSGGGSGSSGSSGGGGGGALSLLDALWRTHGGQAIRAAYPSGAARGTKAPSWLDPSPGARAAASTRAAAFEAQAACPAIALDPTVLWLRARTGAGASSSSSSSSSSSFSSSHSHSSSPSSSSSSSAEALSLLAPGSLHLAGPALLVHLARSTARRGLPRGDRSGGGDGGGGGGGRSGVCEPTLGKRLATPLLLAAWRSDPLQLVDALACVGACAGVFEGAGSGGFAGFAGSVLDGAALADALLDPAPPLPPPLQQQQRGGAAVAAQWEARGALAAAWAATPVALGIARAMRTLGGGGSGGSGGGGGGGGGGADAAEAMRLEVGSRVVAVPPLPLPRLSEPPRSLAAAAAAAAATTGGHGYPLGTPGVVIGFPAGSSGRVQVRFWPCDDTDDADTDNDDGSEHRNQGVVLVVAAEAVDLEVTTSLIRASTLINEQVLPFKLQSLIMHTVFDSHPSIPPPPSSSSSSSSSSDDTHLGACAWVPRALCAGPLTTRRPTAHGQPWARPYTRSRRASTHRRRRRRCLGLCRRLRWLPPRPSSQRSGSSSPPQGLPARTCAPPPSPPPSLRLAHSPCLGPRGGSAKWRLTRLPSRRGCSRPRPRRGRPPRPAQRPILGPTSPRPRRGRRRRSRRARGCRSVSPRWGC